jgi:hypothetical protein
VALVTEQVTSAMGGDVVVSVVYENTGQQLVNSFTVHNGLAGSIVVRVRANNGSVVYEQTFAPGDHTVLPADWGGQNLSWRRATKTTDWNLEVTGP